MYKARAPDDVYSLAWFRTRLVDAEESVEEKQKLRVSAGAMTLFRNVICPTVILICLSWLVKLGYYSHFCFTSYFFPLLWVKELSKLSTAL